MGKLSGWRPAVLAALTLPLALSACQTMQHRPAARLIQAPAASCADINFPIYFEPRSASITREADRLVVAARDQAKGCAVTGIVVIGLADAPGSPDANLALSKRRANAVAAELHKRGFTNAEFREAALGAAGASTAAGADRPLRRRADVSIHLGPAPTH
ncbi:MAG TPA: OmpA family protein [Caulobacteraceae bacterium]|jgi:outer membrane protein OmpA-like peptidoglycan-associated protein